MKVLIAGVDEVGRGSLIGPVYAAAVILNSKREEIARILGEIDFSDKKFIISSYKNITRLKRNKKRIYGIIKDNGGFNYAFDKMLDLKEKNLLIIDNFPENKSKESLKLMLDYLINRKN